jgi:hypothetical protein
METAKGPGVTGATRRRGHKPDPPGRGRTDRGFMAAESTNRDWQTGPRDRSPVGRPTRLSRDQSGEVDGFTASDRGRSLPLSCSAPSGWTRLSAIALPCIAKSGAFLVLAPLDALPTMQDGVLPGGLAGAGSIGPLSGSSC